MWIGHMNSGFREGCRKSAEGGLREKLGMDENDAGMAVLIAVGLVVALVLACCL